MAEHSRKAWLFTRGEWQEIDDPLPTIQEGLILEGQIEPLGYHPYPILFGGKYLALGADICSASPMPANAAAPYPYLIRLHFASDRLIHIPDLPSLLQFLNYIAPISLCGAVGGVETMFRRREILEEKKRGLGDQDEQPPGDVDALFRLELIRLLGQFMKRSGEGG